ncbi:thiolase C-terminal domain-containing protein [Ancylobacter sp.]|uniref:thiolase C-terminal domain-containing protein n=1 Tax=Ancylobacter sp. TaxID=1872567 RepID=UPI003C7A71EB
MENDGAAAIVLVAAERAKDFAHKPAYLLGAASGSGFRAGAHPHNAPRYASAGFDTVAPDLYAMAGIAPADVGVVQSYENFTGGVAMALAEHGFFEPGEANDFLTLENLVAPTGRLPLNTSGGNLAECYMHGFELVLEAVRQVRGSSTSQAARSDVALVIGGPMVTPASDLLLASENVLVNDTNDEKRYLPAGLPIPVSEPDGLSEPYWQGLREGVLRVQRCTHCGTWQFGPEWICHGCHAFDPAWVDVVPRGRIFSWERVWHPAHAALKDHGPYLVVLVELPRGRQCAHGRQPARRSDAGGGDRRRGRGRVRTPSGCEAAVCAAAVAACLSPRAPALRRRTPATCS